MAVEADTSVTGSAPRKRRAARLDWPDRITLGFMTGVPVLLVVSLVLIPAIATVLLSFTRWDGIGVSNIQWIGLDNYREIFEIDKSFGPAWHHNVIWFLFLFLLPTPFGLFLAYLLDKNIRFSRIYQSLFFLPVVLSLAIIGFIWELIYAPDEGLINQLFHITSYDSGFIDWLGDSSINIWAVLVATGWRHAGYIMILYLAGLKSVDSSQREAAAIDGASEWQTFRAVVFPALRPITTVVFVVTVIEALRAFDLAYVINKGQNGLELLSILLTQNIVGEASRIGYGSAYGTILLVIAVVPITIFVAGTFREER